MSKPNEYRPEDMEELLLGKSFRDLYEEEKSFVLKHLSSEEEYEELRRTLLNIRGLSAEGFSSGDDPQPPPQLRENLMSAFRDEQKRRRAVWLNGLALWFREATDVRRPAFRYAMGVLLLAAAVAIWWSKSEAPQIVKSTPKKDTINVRLPEPQLVKKDTQQQQITPPAPAPLPAPSPPPPPQLVQEKKDSAQAPQNFFVDAAKPRALEEDAALIGVFYTSM